MNRKMALDVGDVRIGIAISDSLLITAQGHETLQRIGIKKDTDAIIALAEERDVDTIVVGLPKNLDGSNSVQTDKVEIFKKKLENKLNTMGKGITVVYQDERFTTKIAEQVLIEGNVSRQDRKKVIDKQAAIIILQDYLSSIQRG